MKRLLTMICLFSLPALAQYPTLVQANQPTPSSYTCAFHNNVVSGNILIVATDFFTGGSITGISDTRSTSYTQIETVTSSGITTTMWVGAAPTSGADTVTIAGTANFSNTVCLEVPATYWTSTVDVHTNGTFSGTPATVTSSAVTTTVNGDFFFMFISGLQSGGVLQAASPLIFVGANGGSDSGGSAYKVTDTKGSYTGTFNNVTNTAGNYVVLTLKPQTGIAITTASLPTASLTNAYSYQVHALGGTAAYTWSISSGTLPTGLSINSSTGVISGTPTAGTQTFTVQVTDGTTTQTKSLTLTVNSTAATPAFVQSANHLSGFGSNVTSGNCLLVGADFSNSAGATLLYVPTDTRSTVYSYLGTAQQPNNRGAIMLFGGVAPSSGADTITFSSGLAWVAAEFSGCQGFFDVTSFNAGKSAASATISAGSITTVTPNSMIYLSANAWTATTTMTAVAPFTLDGSDTSSGPVYGEYNLEATVGTYTGQFNQASNTDGDWAISGVALRPSTSGVVASGVRHKVNQY